MSANDAREPLVVVGGAGFLGAAVVERAAARGRPVVSVDRWESRSSSPSVSSVRVDLLTDGLPGVLSDLPPGPVVLAAGNSDPRAVRAWELVLDNAVTTARLLPLLGGRRVTLVSSVEVYGAAPAPQTERTPPELPVDDEALRAWNAEALALAGQPCPPWRAERLCRDLADRDPTGRWVYAIAKRAQEVLLHDAVPAERLTVLRVANLFGPGQDRVVARLTRRARAGLPLVVVDSRRTFLAVGDLAEAVVGWSLPGTFNAGAGSMHLAEVAALVLDELAIEADVRVDAAPAGDAAGVVDTARFREATGVDGDRLEAGMRAFVRAVAEELAMPAGPPVPVVVPPRPERPERLGGRIQQSLWRGCLRDGPWTGALADQLRERLDLPESLTVLPTSSGTDALRLATAAVAGPARPGDVAVLPSFTFAATGEYLAMLGYRLRFCDVRPDSWTIDPRRLDEALAGGDVRVVVVVDALGAPVDYDAVMAVCRRHGVPVVADSAPSLGARWRGRPVGSQADAHAFSMSFAKVVSAAGRGGAVVVPTEAVGRLRRGIDRTRSTVLGEVHAAAALDLLEHLDSLVARRRAVADAYAELEQVDPRVVPQRAAEGDEHAWVHWVARFTGVDRDRLVKELDVLGVGTKAYYGPVLHRLPWGHAAEARRPPLPVSEALHDEALALPMSSELNVGQAERVVWSVLAALNRVDDGPG